MKYVFLFLLERYLVYYDTKKKRILHGTDRTREVNKLFIICIGHGYFIVYYIHGLHL